MNVSKSMISDRIKSSPLESSLSYLEKNKESFTDEEYRYYKANAYYHHKLYDSAEDELEKVLDKNIDSFVLLSKIYYVKEAPKKLSKIAELVDETDDEAKEILLRSYIKNRDFTKAKSLVDEISNKGFEILKMDFFYVSQDYDALEKIAKRLLLRHRNSEIGDVASYYLQKVKVYKSKEMGAEQEVNEAIEKLNRLIGLDSVKLEINKIINLIRFEQQRESAGIVNPNKQSFHMAFYGNPGTGKTTVARLIGDILKAVGVLESGHVVEVERRDLVGEHIGSTAIKTNEKIEEAMGGILFIDEAYTLARGGENDFGIEAIDTLLTAMEDKRDQFVVILAGYTDEMRELLKTNPGLSSRINKEIEFEDFSEQQLVEIAHLISGDSEYKLSEDGEMAFKKRIREQLAKEFFSNARSVRNIIEDAMRTKGVNTAGNLATYEEMTTLTAIDFGIDPNKNTADTLEAAMSELNSLIGLDGVKEQVEDIKNQVLYYQSLEKLSPGRGHYTSTHHMAFTGNPGTGKTTVAKLMGRIFHSMGILPTSKVIEARKSDLVAEYVGQTAPKTKDMCKKAYGGILFVDEAYGLASDSKNDFGSEAINELIQEMENNRDRLVVIFAGYTNEMNKFFDTNPGIRSRISNIIEFSDYKPHELMDIFKLLAKEEGYSWDADVEQLILEHFTEIYNNRNEHFGNGRTARNLFEKVKRKLITRVVNTESQDMHTIIVEDVQNAIQ